VDKAVKSEAIRPFLEAAETLVNPEVQQWRSEGGRAIGYFCSYAPEEVFTAAGLLPYRLRATGSTGTELADSYLSSINCSFTRHCFNMALQGRYGFLDGVVWLNTCDHVRRLYDNWKRKVDNPFLRIMSLPRKTGEPQVEWFRDEIAGLKEALEQHFGVSITDESLRDAIRVHNQTRRLQRQLYELRKADNPPITGAETLAVMVAGTAMPKDRYNRLLSALLGELKHSHGNSGHRARLMLVGGIVDDPGYIEVIEGQGGLVVTDSLCFGSRMAWADVDEGESDPLEALASCYLTKRPHCPRMFGEEFNRADYVRQMARDFRVDGIISERMVFCDQWTGEQYMLAQDSRRDGMPFLQLDREYVTAGIGQLRTRVQAFVETVGR